MTVAAGLPEHNPTELRRRLLEARIPSTLHDGLVAYITQHRPVGHFLTAVLTNDLLASVNRADPESTVALPRLVKFLYNHAPGNCWGSREVVDRWLKDREAQK